MTCESAPLRAIPLSLVGKDSSGIPAELVTEDDLRLFFVVSALHC